MASKLASQLQALAVAGGGSTSRKPSSRPTLLFTPSQAADIDLQTIFSLSQTGLNELIGMDGRFKAFKKTLFSMESSQLDRELQSKEYNEKLNKSITTFLRLLSGYVMLTAAHQTLEYLIRRHKIQVYNVEDVVLCVLPYHETSLFVRVVQLLQIKNTRWQFLEAVQTTGAAPPRTVLVQRCTRDMALVESICELAMAVSGVAAKSKTIISFASVVLIETLAEVPTLSTDLVNRILPFILHSFENGIAEEYRVGALMIIGALANRSSLAPSLVETLFDHISRAFQRGSEREGVSVLQLHVMVMIQLVQTQKIEPFPSKPFKTLVRVRHFIPILTDLVKKFDAQKFLTILVQVLVELCVVHEHYEHALLDVIKSFPVESQVIPSVLSLLNISFGEGNTIGNQAEATKTRDIVKNILLAMEKRFPAELDRAISLHFQNSKVHKGNKTEDPVFIFLSEVFQGSLRIPLEETHMSLYLSLDHPQASIREIAIKQLSRLAASLEPKEGAEIYAVLREAYLRRLGDDDYNVIRAVLLLDNLVKVLPAERLFPALASIISRCNAELMTGERSSKGDVKIISKLVVELLASEFLAQHPGYVEQVAELFFEYILQRPLTWRLNRLILRVAGTIPFHLFADLANVYEETPFSADEEGAKSKERRKVWQMAINAKIIKSLAAKLLEDSSALVPLLFKSSLSDNSKLLLVLILLQCFGQHSKDKNSKVIDASFQWLRDEWAIEGSGKSPLSELQVIDYTKWNDPNSPELYHQLELKSKTVYTELLIRALYNLVLCVPYTNIVKLESDGRQGPLNELFVLFAGSSTVKIFTPHVDLLLSRFPAEDKLPFLSKFFIAEGSAVPAFVQVHSLNVLASQLATIGALKSVTVDRSTYGNLQSVLPRLLVALASPLKAVRRSASQCVEDLSLVWEKHTSGFEPVAKGLDAALLSPSYFRNVLKVVVGAKAAIISSGTYLEELWREHYGTTQESADEVMTGDEDEHRSIVSFFVNQAVHLTIYGQRVVFKILQGMPNNSDLVHATQERLNVLVERRKLAHLQRSSDSLNERLTPAEVQLLEVLLQMYKPALAAEYSKASGADGEGFFSSYFACLTVEGGSLVDPAVLQPCITALKCLTPEFYSALGVAGQDIVFQSLITLSAVSSETVRSSAHASLRILQISSSTVARHLEHLLEVGMKGGNTERRTKRRKAPEEEKIAVQNRWPIRGKLLTSTSSMLEFLVWKSDMEKRHALLTPLFRLLKVIVSGSWPQSSVDEEVLTEGTAANGDQSLAAIVLNAQHLIFMILDRIVKSLTKEVTEQKDLMKTLELDVDTVVMSVNKAEDGATRNHALALLTSLGTLIPDAVLKHLIDILSVVGESTLTQDDSHSHQVVDHMLTAVVPGWLDVEKNPTVLLQVFVNALPRIPTHRRLSTITNLLRVTTEEVGLHVFIFLLLQKARTTLRTEDSERLSVLTNGEHKDTSKLLESLELEFAATLFRQYSPGVKLPAMVKLIDISKVDSTLYSSASPEKSTRRLAWTLQQLATQFVANQLQLSELHVGGQLAASSDSLQISYVALMEQVLMQLQSLSKSDTLPTKLKKGVQEAALSLLDGLTLVMASTEYIKGISSLMKHSDTNIRRKVLRMYSSRIKELNRPILVLQTKKKRENVASLGNAVLTEEELHLQVGIVKNITSLLAGDAEEQSVSTKLAALEALTVSAQIFAEKVPNIFVSSLTAIVTNLQVKNRALGAAAVRCVASILAKLGPLALPALPETVSALFGLADQALATKPVVGADDSSVPDGNDTVEQSELTVAILEALEAMLDKLGAFLTPYLEKIVGLVLLQPQLILHSSAEIHRKAASVRALLPARIPARLLLEPLLSTYGNAIEAGEDSTCALFDMLAAMTAKADRPSVAAYHGRIFEFCLTAFDLRGSALSTLQSVSKVETAVVNAVVSLVMKLSETTFKPLFVKILEWAESETETKDGSLVSQSVDRNIVFYKVVNLLASKLRSVFVPYLQYLMNGCAHHLTGGVSEVEMLKPKKKKKRQSANEEQKTALSPSDWHLRQLILSSLHQCFLYDTMGFLDAQKFQLLLAPIVSQLVVEPPAEVPVLKEGEIVDIPSLQEMDDTLVSCLGQMALTAGTDLLWKPLNHEVLMCTRVENARTRLLGLRVLKFLAEHLKEEYLVLLPETIPFLAELLEDTELTVVAKTQEVVKFLEDLSGEDLSQYF